MKPVNIKTSKTPKNWYALTFIFKNADICNKAAMPIAEWLRNKFSALYYARYNSALEARLDVFFFSPEPPLASASLILKGYKPVRWLRLDGPAICVGSFAHAATCDFVMRFWQEANGLSAEDRRELWCDAIHWAHNMVGCDYVDECRCYLVSLDKIVTVFDNSIKLGNQISASQQQHNTN